MKALARADADCNQADTVGLTPLWIGISDGHLRFVETLLREISDLNKADNDGAMLLAIATHLGYCKSVESLRDT